MFQMYAWIEFIHVASATGWLGVGVATMRPMLAPLEAGAESGASPDALRGLLRRHRGLLALNVLILLSALWAMVLKPT